MEGNPQIENGHVKIANELFEQLIALRLPGQELRIVLAIMRMTYGWNKKEASISYGQLAKMTGIPRVKVIQHIKSLVPKRVLGSSHNGTRTPANYWINKHYLEWVPSPLKGTSPLEGTRKQAFASPHQGTPLKTKEKKRHNIVIPDCISMDLWNEFKKHRRSKNSAMTPFAEKLIINKLLRLETDGYDPNALIEKMIEKSWKSIEADWIKDVPGLKREVIRKVKCCGNEYTTMELNNGNCPICGKAVI